MNLIELLDEVEACERSHLSIMDGPYLAACSELIDHVPAIRRATQRNWIAVNKPIRNFVGDLKPGMLLEFENGTRMLVGDINELTGSCDCCGMRYDTDIVVRYRMLDLED